MDSIKLCTPVPDYAFCEQFRYGSFNIPYKRNYTSGQEITREKMTLKEEKLIHQLKILMKLYKGVCTHSMKHPHIPDLCVIY